SFDAVRYHPRSHKNLLGVFPRDRSNNCYLCQAVKIEGFEGAKPGLNIEISPTLTGVRTDQRTELPGGGFEKAHSDTEAGLTAQWGITPNMALSAAINPDFSQVEADARQLDINQPFAIYYPEKRPFFTEGSDFFNPRVSDFLDTHLRVI
ncbi:MAG: hydrolase, partial [Gammaproteobacteria bacterium]|nr:hydrolase [Gammaproteobacteria bacterium]